MKIVVTGGKNKADFLIGSLLEKKHEVIVINDDPQYCEYLTQRHDIPVYCGDPCQEEVLEDAQIVDADILLALRPNDADNLAICQMAKKVFHVRKVVAIVSNPRQVDIFRALGVNTAISATYMIAKIIEQASTVENLVNTLSIEHEKIVLSEVKVDDSCYCIHKALKDLQLPKNVIVCAILRGTQMIVPNGESCLERQDKLLVLSQIQDQEDAIYALTKGWQ